MNGLAVATPLIHPAAAHSRKSELKGCTLIQNTRTQSTLRFYYQLINDANQALDISFELPLEAGQSLKTLHDHAKAAVESFCLNPANQQTQKKRYPLPGTA